MELRIYHFFFFIEIQIDVTVIEMTDIMITDSQFPF